MTFRSQAHALLGLILGMAALASGTQAEAPRTSNGYSIDDFTLSSSGDLFDVCTVKSSHPDYGLATAFCFGFFEGAWHYDDTISGLPQYVDLVCSPKGTTRTEAVAVFIDYYQANPQYGTELPIDGVFRALTAKWPCP